jgi:hypothetical protein
MKQSTIKQNKERWERSVESLNESLSKLYLAPSKIHGVGVFTREDIKKGEKMYVADMSAAFDLPLTYIKKLKKPLQEDILGMFPYVLKSTTKDRKVFIYPPCPFVCYVNHGEPNYNHLDDTALVDIPAGSEILEDYRVIDDYEKIYKFIKK